MYMFLLLIFSDVVSQASSGRRSAAYSSHSERLVRQGSIISERNSIASGSLASGGLVVGPETGGDTNHLTPQQLGVMGEYLYDTNLI